MKNWLWVIILFFGAKVHGAELFPDSSYVQKGLSFINDLSKGQYSTAASFFETDEASGAGGTPMYHSEYYSDSRFLGFAWKTIEESAGKFEKIGDIKFDATQYEAGKLTIRCIFSKMTLDVQIYFGDNLMLASFSAPPFIDDDTWLMPAYADFQKVAAEPIVVRTDTLKLNGEYLYPRLENSNKIPIVILVHGSGVWDMNENLMGNEPFKDLAYGLASRGIGVLRYDKRNDHAIATPSSIEEETILDAISAIKLAKTLEGVDTSKIFVLGHSLGAMAAPRIAKECGMNLAGIIIMAGPARPLEDVLIEQAKFALTIKKPVDEADRDNFEKLRNQAQVVKSDTLKPGTSQYLLPMQLPGSYWLDLRQYKQVETAKQFNGAILVLQGENDALVSMKDFELWGKGLKDKPNAKFIAYPKLNHPFMECESKAAGADYSKLSHVADYVINDIGKFVMQ